MASFLPQIKSEGRTDGKPQKDTSRKANVPAVNFPPVASGAAKPKTQKKDKSTKGKALPKVQILEKSMDEDTRAQLHKLLRGSTTAAGDIIHMTTTIPTTQNFEGELCKAFHQAFVEKNQQKQSIVLQQLGDLYLQRAKDTQISEDIFNSDGTEDIMRSVSAYSGALNRTLHADQIHLLQAHIRDAIQVYVGMFQANRKSKVTEPLETTNTQPAQQAAPGEKYKRRIDKMREYVRKRLNRLQDMWKNKFNISTRLPSRGQDFETTKEVLTLGNKIKTELKTLFKDIVRDCLEKLGPPPCKYSIVAIGDLALGYATPYSDFQYIILTEKEVIDLDDYFTFLANLINIEMLLLGETPLTATNLDLIRDPMNKFVRVIYDDHTTNGIKIDISACGNSINPFIFKYSSHIEESDQDVDLIKTPAQMVRYMYMLHDKGHLAFALAMYQSMLICGDADTFNMFKNMVEESFVVQDATPLDEPTLSAREHVVRLATEQYNINYFLDCMCDNSNFCLRHLVNDIKEFPTILYAMKLVYGISARQPIAIVEEMRMKGLMSEELEGNIKATFCILYFLRLRLDQVHECQFVGKNIFKPNEMKKDAQDSEDREPINFLQRLFNMTDIGILFRVYKILLPLSRALQTYDSVSNPLPSLKLDFKQLETVVHYQVHYRIMDYTNALETLRSMLSLDLTSGPLDIHFETLTNLGYIALRCGQVSLAISIFTHAMETASSFENKTERSLAVALTNHNMGLVHLHERKMDKAEKLLKQAADEYQTTQERSDNVIIANLRLFFTPMLQTTLGRLYWLLGDVTKALSHFHQVLDTLNPLIVGTSVHIYQWKRAIALQLIEIHHFIGEFKYARMVISHMTESDMKRFCVVSPLYDFIEDIHCIASNLKLTSKFELSKLYGVYALRMVEYHFDTSIELQPRDLVLFGDVDKLLVLRKWRDLHSLLSRDEEYLFTAQLTASISLGIQSEDLYMVTLNHAKDLIEYSRALKFDNQAHLALEHVMSVKQMFSKLPVQRANSFVHAESLFEIGVCLLLTGNLDNAVKNFNKSWLMYKAMLGKRMVPSQLNIVEQKAVAFRVMKKYEESLKAWEECITFRRQVFGNVHAVVAASFRKQGLLLQEIMDFDMAVVSLQTALKMYKILNGKDNMHVADIYFDLGRVYSDMLENDKAEQHLKRALEVCRYLSRGSDDTAKACAILTYIGRFYRQINKVKFAIDCHECAIRSSEIVFGTDSWQHAQNHAELGEDLHVAEIYEECVEHYETAISIHEEYGFDAEHNLEVANWLRELGRVYEILGIRDKASLCHKQSLVLKEQCMGKEAADADLLDSLVKLAENNEKKGDFKRAIPLRRQYLKKHKQITKDVPNVDTKKGVTAISKDYLEIREFEHALSYNQQLLDLLPLIFSGVSLEREVAEAIFFRGFIYDQMGRVYRAIKFYRSALLKYRILNATGQDCREQMVVALIQLGNILTIAGQDSQDILKEAVSLLGSKPKDQANKVLLAQAYHCLGEANENYPRYKIAANYHERALKLRKEIYKQPHTDIADSLRSLGKAKCQLQLFSDGVSLLLRSLDMWKALNQPSKQHAHALLEIGKALTDANKPNSGLEYLFQALKMFKDIYGEYGSHFYVARSYEYIAVAYLKAHREQDTLKYAEMSLSSYRDILSYIEDHPIFAHMNDILGDAYMNMKRYEKAVLHYKKASQMFLAIHNGSIVTWDVQQAMAKYKNACSVLEKYIQEKNQ